MPRPAMFVAMVTPPGWPARAMMPASRAWFFALRTSWGTPRLPSSPETSSFFWMEVVPTRIGRPVLWTSTMCSTRESYFSFAVR